mgnify:CR=1 FL=1
MNFKTRLKQLRNERGISQRQLSEFLKVAPSTISMYENGQREPNFEVLESLADFFNVDLNYLLGKTNKTTKIILDSESSKGIQIPVLGTVPAGIPMSAIEDIIDYEEIPKSWENQGEFFGLKIKGDSMYPTLENGDVVIVKKQSTADNGDTVIVMVNGDDATCKRYERSDTGIMLIPNNSAYNPVFYTNEEIEALPLTIIGKVIELRRKF